MECVSLAGRLFWKQSGTASGFLARGWSHGTGIIQRCCCCSWRQSLGLQRADTEVYSHRQSTKGSALRMDVFWRQSGRERVTEGLAGRRRGCMVVGDMIGKDRREKRLSNQCPGSRPAVLQNALATELSHVTSDSYVPSALSSFAKRKSSLECSESLFSCSQK
jgi:hypothetical protein